MATKNNSRVNNKSLFVHICLTWCISSDQAKVSNLQVVIFTGEEDVGGFQVAVDEPLPMNIDHCFQNLVVEKGYEFNLGDIDTCIHKHILPSFHLTTDYPHSTLEYVV